MIEKLKENYSIYENSAFFIDSTFEALRKIGSTDKTIKYFIDQHFRNTKECDFVAMKKNATHWNNVAFDKLNQFDFSNYKYSLITVANYRILAKILEPKK